MSTDTTQASYKILTDAPEGTGGVRVYRALTDIVEAHQDISLQFEMPGAGPGDAATTLEDRVMTIRGKVEQIGARDREPVCAEHGDGDFEQAFALADDVDHVRIGAEMRNGVLTASLACPP